MEKLKTVVLYASMLSSSIKGKLRDSSGPQPPNSFY